MARLKDLMNLSGRVACITGGGGHIGSAMAEGLAELGASIALLDLDRAACENAAGKIEQDFHVPTLPIVSDLADDKEVREVPRIILDRFQRLDILINCAALVGTSQLQGWTVPLGQQRTDTWRLALDVNLTAPFVLIQVSAGALAASGHGSVINIGSLYGVAGPDMRLYEDTTMGNAAAYAASKGGLLQLTRWLATVLAPSVRVNAISPGGIWRHQPQAFCDRYISRTPLQRMGTEEDFVGAAAYLASDMSRYVTGQNLLVDGGFTVW